VRSRRRSDDGRWGNHRWGDRRRGDRRRGYGLGHRVDASRRRGTLRRRRPRRDGAQAIDQVAAGGVALARPALDRSQRTARAVDQLEQDGDVPRCELEGSVAQLRQQRLAGVGQLLQLTESQESGRPLDGVDRSKHGRDAVARCWVLLERDEIAVQQIEVLVRLDQELAGRFIKHGHHRPQVQPACLHKPLSSLRCPDGGVNLDAAPGRTSNYMQRRRGRSSGAPCERGVPSDIVEPYDGSLRWNLMHDHAGRHDPGAHRHREWRARPVRSRRARDLDGELPVRSRDDAAILGNDRAQPLRRAFRSSAVTTGFARPCVAFITWPTKNENRLSLPPR
jgi:hypothetical protein